MIPTSLLLVSLLSLPFAKDAQQGVPAPAKPHQKASASPKNPAEVLEITLAQLRDLQADDGSWGGRPETTALALLAFSGDGNTVHSGPHKEGLRGGLTWLLGQSQENGDLGAGNPKAHVLATAYLAECFNFGKSPRIKQALSSALEHLAHIKVASAPDLLIWAGLAAATAREAKVRIPESLKTQLDESLSKRPKMADALPGVYLAKARWFEEGPAAEWSKGLEELPLSDSISVEEIALRLHAHFQVSDESFFPRYRQLLPRVWLQIQAILAVDQDASPGQMETLAFAALCLETPWRLARVGEED